MTANRIDGVLVEWGERLFYPSRHVVRGGTPRLSMRQRAEVVRRHIHAVVIRNAPQVMVKVTGGGRGMAAIAAHLRYISKSGRLPFEDDRGMLQEGREALQDVLDQWRHGGSRIPEQSARREAFNIMLSMPWGTQTEIVRNAAREFAQAELGNHRWVMVLHAHQANPHVHLAVRAEGREGIRLNPRKADLRRWREVFAERLRGWGIEAEATTQVARGSQYRAEPLWRRKAHDDRKAGSHGYVEARVAPARLRAARAWSEIAKALASSDSLEDRELGRSVGRYAHVLPGSQHPLPGKRVQQELPGLGRTAASRTGPEQDWVR